MSKYRSLIAIRELAMKKVNKSTADTYGTLTITFDALPSRNIRTIYHEHYPAELKLGNYVDNGFAAVNAILGTDRNFISDQVSDPMDINLSHAFPPLWISKKLHNNCTSIDEKFRIIEYATEIQRKFYVLWLIHNNSYLSKTVTNGHLEQLEMICGQCYCPQIRKEIMDAINVIRFCRTRDIDEQKPTEELFKSVRKFINTGRYGLLVSIC